jgi:hypothetical protein
VSVLHKEARVRARQGEEVNRALYREELRQAARERDSYLQQANEASSRIERLLPGAVGSGLPVVEIARLTGWSRPTLYRMLARSRQEQDFSSVVRQLEEDLARATDDFGSPAGLYHFAGLLRISQDDLRHKLEDVFPILAQELEAFGSVGGIFLIDLLPSIPPNEKVVLAPLFLQRQSIEAVAESARQPTSEVIAWAALGLLRLLPELRTRVAEEKAAQSAEAN